MRRQSYFKIKVLCSILWLGYRHRPSSCALVGSLIYRVPTEVLVRGLGQNALGGAGGGGGVLQTMYSLPLYHWYPRSIHADVTVIVTKYVTVRNRYEIT